ncbi:MAG: hypothetical protein ABJP70_09005 [Erythrobacter sp.]
MGIETPFSTKGAETALSFGLLFFAFFVFILTRDIFYDPWGFEDINEYHFWSSFNSLLVILFFLVPTIIWHISDKSAMSDRAGVVSKILNSYPVFLALLLCGLIGNALIETGYTEWLDCLDAHIENSDGDNFGSTCTPTPAALSEFLVLPFLCAASLLAFAKAGVAILRLRK